MKMNKQNTKTTKKKSSTSKKVGDSLENKNEIHICINQELVDEYNAYYKQQNPRTRKAAIESPLCINFNEYNAKGNRIIQHEYKKKWGGFISWICEKQGIKDLKLQNCSTHYHFTYDTRRRHDLDNNLATTAKFTQDSLVKCGVMEDDSYTILSYLSCDGEYIKGIKQTDIIITYR